MRLCISLALQILDYVQSRLESRDPGIIVLIDVVLSIAYVRIDVQPSHIVVLSAAPHHALPNARSDTRHTGEKAAHAPQDRSPQT